MSPRVLTEQHPSHLLARSQLSGSGCADRAHERHKSTENRVRKQAEEDRAGKEVTRERFEEKEKRISQDSAA